MAEHHEPCRQPGLPERMTREIDHATEVVVERILEEIPLYRALDPVQLADVQETVRAGYLATMQLWEAGGTFDREQLERFRANGATRAAEGRPLPLVLRAYRVSGLGIYDYVVSHPEVALDPLEERNFARLTMAIVDQLSNEVTIGYVETSSQLAGQQGRARREFLEDLLAGRLLAAGEVAERARTLGLNVPRRPSLAVAAPSAGEGGTLVDRARAALKDLGDAARWQLITRGQLVVILDEVADLQPLRRALDGAELTGVVLNVSDLTEIAAAYQRARSVHELLHAANLPAGRTVDHDEALLLSLLARVRRDAAVEPAVAAILGDLRAPANAALVETLDAYFLAGNAVSAAHRLGVHAQTMRYRLNRIREITGRDPAQGWDRFLLELALRVSARPSP